MFAMKHPVLTARDDYGDEADRGDGPGTEKEKYTSEPRYAR